MTILSIEEQHGNTAPLSANPLISLIMPTYNRPDTLLVALDSVCKQNYPDIETIVVNDGGCDLEHVLNPQKEKMTIKYYCHARNKGPSAARNTGIRNAKGKYITYLDDDDIIYPDHIRTLVDFLESTSYRVAYSDSYRILQERRQGQYITLSKSLYHSQDFNRDYFLVASYISIQSIMHEKACLELAGLFDESLSTHEDLDMWIRLSHFFDFWHIPKITSEFHEKNDGISVTSLSKQRRLTNLELIYNRYRQWATPEIKHLQKHVLQKMYKNYNLEMPLQIER